ncbi:MAG: hypothetical protein GC164_12495 [Phycisphaera sp.]|nr:hypothetical protein [Phycisphaera sp.]
MSCATLLLVTGCTKVRQTDPMRTATEIYLFSVASQRAVAQLAADELTNKSVYIDNTFMGHPEYEYLVACARAKLLELGVKLTEHREEADIIVELRTPGVGIDRREFLVGIPGIPVGDIASSAGIPAASVSTPELALVKSDKQWGTAGIAYIAYERETGFVVAKCPVVIGRSYREDWSFFGLTSTASNIPPSDPP